MKEDERIVQVSDLSRGGAGIARDSDGRVLFIPYTAPGDQVRVRILSSEKNFAQAEVIEFIHLSEVRQKPLCPVFGKCGGCQWQHLPYSLQWETKFKGVLDALKRAGVEVPENPEPIPAEQIWGYRNRVQLRGYKNEIGFFGPKSQNLVPTDHCPIARPEINQVWEEVRVEGSHKKDPYKVEVEVLPSGKVKQFWNLRHGAGGFRQVHDLQNEKLRTWIFNRLNPADVLLDLFGGAGNLSLPFIGKMKEIHCVDRSVPDARSLQIPASFHFHRTSVIPWLNQNQGLSSFQGKQISAILDPPRAGLGKDLADIAAALENLKVREIVMVGCDPDSWARDLSKWKKEGWDLSQVMMIDLFPQTPHIESVALLKHKKYNP